MLKRNLIPVLLLLNGSLVKTRQFNHIDYIGDPINTVKIFNEFEVDELFILDIYATSKKRIEFMLLREIASECFMPLAYGGGISSVEQAKQIFDLGYEKVVLNTAIHKNPEFVTKLAKIYGSQAIVASVEVKNSLFNKYRVVYNRGKSVYPVALLDWVKEVEKMGVGEILLTSVDRDGTWLGYDEELIAKVADAVNIPIICNGGASSTQDISSVKKNTSVSATAASSLVLYQKKGMGVLVNFPQSI